MKITKITDTAIIFDNGNSITYDHAQDCCEFNYADFSIITPNTIGYDWDFNTDLQFQVIEDMGFIFGDEDRKIFVPCYSEQNGYYSTDIDIYYNYKNGIRLRKISLNAQYA